MRLSTDDEASAGRSWSGLVALALALVCLLAVAGPASAQLFGPKLPKLTGRVVDQANVLSAEAKTRIEAELKDLEGHSSDQIVVVTVPSLDGLAIEDYSIRLAEAWKIGQKGTDNGVILLIAPAEHKVRIEVGRGLEGILTDTMSGLIIRNAITPAFRRGDIDGGVEAGVRDMKDTLLGDAEGVKDRLAHAPKRSAQGDQIDWVPIIFFLFWLAIVILSIRAQMRTAQAYRNLPPGMRPRVGYGGPHVIVIPGGFGSGSWGGGFGGGGGGGFGGGGGSFGGGGASGSW